MLLWLVLGATIAIPFALRVVLLRRYNVRRWAANLAAIGFLPGIALAGCTVAIASMTQQEKIHAGMSMIFPLFVVGLPLIAALVAVTVAEFMEHIG